MYYSSIEGLNLAISGRNGNFERDQNQKFIFFWSVSVLLTVIEIPDSISRVQIKGTRRHWQIRCTGSTSVRTLWMRSFLSTECLNNVSGRVRWRIKIEFKLHSAVTDSVSESAVVSVAGVDDHKFAKCPGFRSKRSFWLSSSFLLEQMGINFLEVSICIPLLAARRQ